MHAPATKMPASQVRTHDLVRFCEDVWVEIEQVHACGGNPVGHRAVLHFTPPGVNRQQGVTLKDDALLLVRRWIPDHLDAHDVAYRCLVCGAAWRQDPEDEIDECPKCSGPVLHAA